MYVCMYIYIYIYIAFDAVAPQVMQYLSVLRGANARAGEAFALRETPLWTQ